MIWTQFDFNSVQTGKLPKKRSLLGPVEGRDCPLSGSLSDTVQTNMTCRGRAEKRRKGTSTQPPNHPIRCVSIAACCTSIALLNLMLRVVHLTTDISAP